MTQRGSSGLNKRLANSELDCLPIVDFNYGWKWKKQVSITKEKAFFSFHRYFCLEKKALLLPVVLLDKMISVVRQKTNKKSQEQSKVWRWLSWIMAFLPGWTSCQNAEDSKKEVLLKTHRIPVALIKKKATKEFVDRQYYLMQVFSMTDIVLSRTSNANRIENDVSIPQSYSGNVFGKDNILHNMFHFMLLLEL